MHQHFGDLEGLETDIDEIVVHVDTAIKHDSRLHTVLDRGEKINLTLKKEKCVIKVKEVTYLGHKLTQERIKPSDEKFMPSRTRQHPPIRKGQKDSLDQLTIWANSFPIWQQ